MSAHDLGIFRNRDWVLEHLSFSIEKSRVTGLTGPNGAGKSTLFEALMGFIPVAAGRLEWGSISHSIAYLPQQASPQKLMPLTVKDFIRMGTWVARKNCSGAALSIDEAMASLNLESIGDELVSALSGGQWKRTCIARCLVQPADLYLCDEPFNHLDFEIEMKLSFLLRKIAEEKQKTIFIISHDWHAMEHACDRVILLNRKLIAEGSVKEMAELSMNWRNPEHHGWMHT